MKYVIYLRVSTDQQVQSGLGLQAQRELCLNFISKNPADYLEFSDEGFSGSLDMDKRPALMAAINSLEKGDILLVAKRDRIGRDTIGNAMIERAVERKKARLVSASGDVRDDNDPSSILMRRMIDAFAEYERLIIGARVKAALGIKKNKGQCVGHVPYGFKRCLDNVHLEPCRKEQRILKIINESKKKGYHFEKSLKI